MNIGTGKIAGVRREVIDGRPQLVLDVEVDGGDGTTWPVILDRETARELTKAFGHHPLVDEFFADGEGLQ